MMKKVLFFCAVFVLTVSCTAFSQQANVNVKFGVNGMYNVGETDVKQMAKDFIGGNPGYQIGVEYQAKLVSILGFRGEANYVNGKFSYMDEKTTGQLPDGTIGNFKVTEVMNIVNNGIQIPTSLTLDLGLLDLNLGPNFEFLFSSIATGDLTAINADSIAQSYQSKIDYDFFNDAAGAGAYFDKSIKDGSFFNAFNIGLNLGVGVKLGKLRVDLKTNYTLTDAVNDYYQTAAQGETLDRPISFQLSAVYRLFDIGGGDKKDKEPDTDEEPTVDVLFGW